MLSLMRIHRGEYGGARDALTSSLEEVAWVRFVVDEDAAAAIDALEEASRLFVRIRAGRAEGAVPLLEEAAGLLRRGGHRTEGPFVSMPSRRSHWSVAG